MNFLYNYKRNYIFVLLLASLLISNISNLISQQKKHTKYITTLSMHSSVGTNSITIPSKLASLPLKSTKIKINDQHKVTVSSKEIAESLLKKIKYSNIPEEFEKIEIQSQSFLEKIEIVEGFHDLSPIQTEEEALDILLDPIDKKQFYIVQEGDSFWDIAASHNLSVEELLEANPDLDPALLQVGDQIFFTVSQPLIHVKTVANINYEESIPFETDIIEDPSLLMHTSKVLEPGEAGLKNVSAEVILHNGQVIEKKILLEETIKKPKNQKVSKGTKPASINDVSYLPRPVTGPITSLFGRRWGRMHNGIDIGVSSGTPVKAIFDGKVTFAGYNGAYGNLVILQHTDGYSTYYAHNSKLNVSVNQKIKQGDVIAYSGNTGRSTGPHVHLEIRKDGIPVNPSKYIQ